MIVPFFPGEKGGGGGGGSLLPSSSFPSDVTAKPQTDEEEDDSISHHPLFTSHPLIGPSVRLSSSSSSRVKNHCFLPE